MSREQKLRRLSYGFFIGLFVMMGVTFIVVLFHLPTPTFLFISIPLWTIGFFMLMLSIVGLKGLDYIVPGRNAPVSSPEYAQAMAREQESRRTLYIYMIMGLVLLVVTAFSPLLILIQLPLIKVLAIPVIFGGMGFFLVGGSGLALIGLEYLIRDPLLVQSPQSPQDTLAVTSAESSTPIPVPPTSFNVPGAANRPSSMSEESSQQPLLPVADAGSPPAPNLSR